MLPRAARLHTSREFSAVMRSGRRAATSRLVVHLLTPSFRPPTPAGSPSAPARAGFVVSRQVGNSVVRHRVTRQLRPLVRSRLATLPPGTEMVVRALPAAAGASSAALEGDLSAGLRVAARRAGITVGVAS